MAEVDFGDSELFQQFDENLPLQSYDSCLDNGEGTDDVQGLRDRLGECEEIIASLKAENQELKRKLNILSRPSGINIQNSKSDGPLLQILFANNDISKQYRQEIEDSIFGLIKKHEQQVRNDKDQASCHGKPQTSSFVLEENHKVKPSNTAKKIKEAFSVVGSVLYFTNFCLDRLGQPLLNENPPLTEGWEIPKYQQIFSQVISLDGQEMQIKDKRPKSCCFNCGLEDHQLKDCPKPKDMNRINEKRKEFSQGSTLSNQRYHAEEVEERFGKYKPGVVSVELLDALGVSKNSLPPFIYRMRQLGYPPGWLKEAETETSGLALYDGKVSSDGEVAEDEHYQSHKISYDVSRLVDFPGFNVSAPANVVDEWKLYGSVPMQPTHMKQNFAAYLSKTFPGTRAKCSKRPQESDSTPRRSKKRRSDIDQSSDMDVESGSETPCSSKSSDNFQFQPPLPPGSPSVGTPPPLPRGTPPATPTPPPVPKGTPPATPNNSGSSPAFQGQTGSGVEDLGEEEDGLTLEELEEQQRLIWAALANADTATNSDSEAPAVETPLASSPSSTPMQLDADMEEHEGVAEREVGFTSKSAVDPGSPALADESLLADDDDKEVDYGDEAKGNDHNGATEKSKSLHHNVDVVQEKLLPPTEVISPQPDEGDPASPMQDLDAKKMAEVVGKVTSVPHRSRFAAGIIPFEDTPEYRDVAEATGVYLRIRDLLKCSPRSQTKNKK